MLIAITTKFALVVACYGGTAIAAAILAVRNRS